MKAKIIATGAYVPALRISNDELAEKAGIDTNDEWIRTRTGIRQRYLSIEETVAEMAAKAAEDALSSCAAPAEGLDLIIVATSSTEAVFPSTACLVQEKIGAVNAVCYDINAACSGFVYAMNMAQAFLASGQYRTALIVGADRMSEVLDWKDRSTCVLFGDGAGAAVLEARSEGFYHMYMYSDGRRGGALTLSHTRQQRGVLAMDGQEVFKFACKKVPECIRHLLEASGASPRDVKYYFIHQANYRIIEAVAKRLLVPIEQFPVNVAEYGNTSAASVPILLHEWNRAGRLAEHDTIVLAGFGAGLTCGAAMLNW